MRNPYDRLVSPFFWQLGPRKHPNPRLGPVDFVVEQFEAFVEKKLGDTKQLFDPVYKIRGEFVVTDWIKFKNLAADTHRLVPSLFPNAGSDYVPITEIKTKANFRPMSIPVETFYQNSDLSDRVFEVFSPDLERLGFLFKLPHQ